MDIQYHQAFEAELDRFVRKHCYGDMTVEKVLKQHEKILRGHFERQNLISPNHLGLAQGFGDYTVYFWHMLIDNCYLKRKQQPKCYFYKQDNLIILLCCDSHINNYADSKLRSTARERLYEVLEDLKSR